MKTLIFNGSPRKNGDTAYLLKCLKESLNGEVFEVSAYYDEIKPCIDCRFCMKFDGCAQKDGMTKVYEYIKECDNIIIASPVYFSELTGPLLSVMSRLQAFYCAKYFRNSPVEIKVKRGGIILTGGGDGSPKRAISTANIFLSSLNVKDTFEPVLSLNTNKTPAKDDPDATAKIKSISNFLNENFKY